MKYFTNLFLEGAAAARLPEKPLQQLKYGGTMIIPVGEAGAPQELLFVRVILLFC